MNERTTRSVSERQAKSCHGRGRPWARRGLGGLPWGDLVRKREWTTLGRVPGVMRTWAVAGVRLLPGCLGLFRFGQVGRGGEPEQWLRLG